MSKVSSKNESMRERFDCDATPVFLRSAVCSTAYFALAAHCSCTLLTLKPSRQNRRHRHQRRASNPGSDHLFRSGLATGARARVALVDARPASPELNQALKTLEDQLLILQEARKLPLARNREAQKEFEDTVKQRRR